MKTLAKLLYVEADEEITDLVDRLRDLSLEDAVTFVVPERSRALQSPMSFRLLKRYADSYGKHVNVISGDPRLQALSLETGFSAYPSLQAYDGGAEVHRPGAAEVDSLEPDVPAFVPPPAGRKATVISSAPRRQARAPESPRDRPAMRDYRPYLIGAAVLALIGLLALLLYVPTAAVTLSVQGTPLTTDVQLLGSPSTPAGASDGVPTQALHARESQTVQGTATGQKQVPAVPSGGKVVITSNCIFCNGQSLPKGLVVRTDGGKRYATQEAARLAGLFGASATISIAALTPGVDGNTDAHTITTIERGDPDLKVDNPDPTTGGADPRSATVIQQSDIDSIVTAYATTEVPKVQDELNAKAPGQRLVPVGNGVASSVSADHKVGDELQSPFNFNVTVTVAGDAVAFDEKKVKSMLRDALSRKVPPGSQLTENPTLTYEATGATRDGGITLNGHAVGSYTPVFLENKIRAYLKGKSPSSAHAFLLQKLPNVVDARIVQAPFSLPWLPFFSSHINLKVVEVAGSPSP